VHVVAGEHEAGGAAVHNAGEALRLSVRCGLGFGGWGLGFGACLHVGLGELQQLLRFAQTGAELEGTDTHLRQVLQFQSERQRLRWTGGWCAQCSPAV